MAQRQKQHFARARQQLQNGLGPTAMAFQPSWSIGANSLRLDTTFDKHGQNLSRDRGQTKLEDYELTAPLAQRLSVMSTRSPARGL